MYKRFFHGIKLVSLFSYLSIFLFDLQQFKHVLPLKQHLGGKNCPAIQPANQYLCVSYSFISYKFWLLIGSPNVV